MSVIRRIGCAAAAALSLGSSAALGQADAGPLVGDWDCAVIGRDYVATAEISYAADGGWTMRVALTGVAPTGETVSVDVSTSGIWSVDDGAGLERRVEAVDVVEYRVNGESLPSGAAERTAQGLERSAHMLTIVQVDDANLIIEYADGSGRELCTRS